MILDGISALVVVLIASFAVERITTAALFLLDFLPIWRQLFPTPDTVEDPVRRDAASRRRTLAYFVLAGLLGGIGLAYFGQVRIFQALDFDDINPMLDAAITGLIFVAGADRLGTFMQLAGQGTSGKGGGSGASPIEITGTLILQGDTPRTPGPGTLGGS